MNRRIELSIEAQERLRLAVKSIEAEPDQFDMRLWVMADPNRVALGPMLRFNGIYSAGWAIDMNVCGTTMCLAGQLLYQEGLTLTTAGYAFQGGQYAGCIQAVAENLLGIDGEAGHVLFVEPSESIRTPNDLKEYLTEVTNITFD